MTSRNEILDRVRKQHIADVPHPGDFQQGIVYPDPIVQFQKVLAGVGGRCELIESAAAATTILDAVPEYASAAMSCSRVPGVGSSSFDLDAIADPHDLADVDYSILPGELVVAENAAVWVTTADVNVRTLYFLTQHLALVVPRSRVVSSMHQAYEQVSVDTNPFGTWISGPSKTADIEQSLVKGAHGSRSLLVFLIDD